jgi:hypothetical protein
VVTVAKTPVEQVAAKMQAAASNFFAIMVMPPLPLSSCGLVGANWMPIRNRWIPKDIFPDHFPEGKEFVKGCDSRFRIPQQACGYQTSFQATPT